jgi:threonine dehydratase
VRDGVVTHSSGNHAQALALAARLAGIPARIVMPKNAPAPKRAAVEGYGARVFLSEPTQAAREELTRQILEEQGGAFIHPYDNRDVIAGQGTAALELLQQVQGLEDLIVPVGGGGLLSGTLLGASQAGHAVWVYGGEPAGADDAARSLASGQRQPMDRPDTIADGLRTSLGELTFPIIRDMAADILLAEDDRIIEAMRLIWERLKLVVEPSGAVPLAALLAHKERFAGRRVGIILSGGNVDLNHLPWRSS